MSRKLTDEDLEVLEEEVRWLLTWNMTPVRIAYTLGLSCNALAKRFERLGADDLIKLFRYNDESRKATNVSRQRRARASKRQLA